jgi:tetratricopeptide (TPR) repeat protein
MKNLFIFLLIVFFIIPVSGQNQPDYSKIDLMLVKGEYAKAIDTCKLILSSDSLNAEIYYRLGLAYQNTIPDENSISCFIKASKLAPERDLYKYTIAKNYFNKDKKHLAKPLFEDLYSRDTLNWSYAYYLTSIYLEGGRYNSCIDIYQRFYRQDPSNYIILDKLGYAFLRKNQTEIAIDYFNESLKKNPKNINAIKNLSYLYPHVNKLDTAIILLTRAIAMDPEDIDLYARRATIYYAKHYGKKTLDDYLKILASGDTTFIYLKRAGISYMLNMQPKEATQYLWMANKMDTTDYETLDYLARCYKMLNDPVKTRFCYNKIIDVLEPIAYQLGVANVMLGEEFKRAKMYDDALKSYNRSQELMHDVNITLMIANIYDQELNNGPKAITFYRQFLNTYKSSPMFFTAEHIDALKKRLEYLEEQQKTKAAQAKK